MTKSPLRRHFIGALAGASALAAPWVAPHDPTAIDARTILAGPSGGHLLGTDDLGRDVLSRMIYGSRVSLSIAAAVVLISGAVGVTLGVISGYFGGRVDFLIQLNPCCLTVLNLMQDIYRKMILMILQRKFRQIR